MSDAARTLSNQFLPPVADNVPAEFKLWAEVIRQAIRDAVRLVRHRPAEDPAEYHERRYQKATARAWLYGGECARLLVAMGVNPEYFFRKLREFVPE